MWMLRWIIIVPLLCLWLICVIFNYRVLYQHIRNKLTHGGERVPSMLPLVGGICLVLIGLLFPTMVSQYNIPTWVMVLICLLDPGSVTYVLFIVIAMPV